MFELSEETRNNIVEILRDKFALTHSDEEISVVIDEVVDTVKRQFGM